MGYQSDICLSFSVFGVSLVLPLWICLCSFHHSRFYCITWGKKRKKRQGRKNIRPLLTLNRLSEFCWFSWMPQAEGAWVSFLFLPMVL